MNPAPLVPHCGRKRRICKLPTIPESVEENMTEEVASQACLKTNLLWPESIPSDSSASLPIDPMNLCADSSWADTVTARLKDACCSERHALIAWLSAALPWLAFTEMGSAVVQFAFTVARGVERDLLMCKLHGSILELSTSAHGHLVVATLVETMPVSAIGFVAQELAGQTVQIARHRFGYRVLEALIMHCAEPQLTRLAQEIIQETVTLSKHAYGHSVILHLLEYGTKSCKADIVRKMMPDIHSLAMDRTSPDFQ